eukprot:572885_1
MAMTDLEILMAQNTTTWLSTTASQIFFMQLGFLCYEVGFVKAVWTKTVILKNIEDTFVGILTFFAFGYTLSLSSNSFYGIISIPSNPFLIGVHAKLHNAILISAFFATTCATIISGAVLERMKNGAYITWCLLTILLNYSFVSHWVWHSDGWLSKLGFVDGAGAVVVHATAGMASLIAMYKLGPRRDSVDTNNGKLLPVQHAANPVIHAMGAFFLWYGWFAFNVASPVAFDRHIGDALGTAALVTVITPIASSCAAFAWMHFGFVKLSFESLLGCLLAGLVSCTAVCHTCDVWSATVIGVLSSPIYFGGVAVVRSKWGIDDPLQVVSIHLFCGIWSGIAEGVVANDTYNTPGLIYSGSFTHLGVQLLGVAAICAFNFVLSLFLYEILMSRVLYRTVDIRVSILDIYLGTRLFDQDYEMALDEVLNCKSNMGKQMLWHFHDYMNKRYASEQLDFLVVTKVFMTYLQGDKVEFDAVQSAKYILKIIDTYVDNNGAQCINVSGTQRSILMKIRKRLWLVSAQKTPITKEEVQGSHKRRRSSSLIGYQAGSYKSGIDITKENVFEAAYKAIWRIVIPHFMNFLLHEYTMEKKHNFDVRIPFKLNKDWVIEWDDDLTKDSKRYSLLDTVPQHDGSLLRDYVNVDEQRPSTNTETQMAAAQANASVEIGEYPIVFVNAQTKKDHEYESVVVIE